MKLIKRVKIAHSFLVCAKSVPRYHFKLAYVVLQMAAKNFSKSTSKNGEIGHFKSVFAFRVILADLEMLLTYSI